MGEKVELWKPKCHVPGCEWDFDPWLLEIQAMFMATWHVYEEHKEVWRQVIGDRPPKDPDPRTEEGMERIMSHLLGIESL